MTRTVDTLPGSLRSLHRLGMLRDLDLYLVESLVRRFATDPPASEKAMLLAALTSRALGEGHVCLDLRKLSPEWILTLQADRELTLEALPAEARSCKEACIVSGEHPGLLGAAADEKPFVLADHRVYLRRYWDYEQAVAAQLLVMGAEPPAGVTVSASAGKKIGNLMSGNPAQAAAAVAALTRRLTIISGGPGTGKTYTAARILYLLLRLSPDPLVVRMAAPTGKAAARLEESLREAVQNMGGEAVSVCDAIEPATTVDRLLGFVADSPYYRHNRENPLRADVLLVDEASMLDLPKTAKMLEALDTKCRLVLLGDMHQLASVDPGSVLADLCQSEKLSACVVELKESRRFTPGSPVAEVSALVNKATCPPAARKAWDALQAFDDPAFGRQRIRRRDMPDQLVDREGAAVPALVEAVAEGYRPFLEAKEPGAAFAALAEFRVLCALRRGPQGAEAINERVEEILSGQAAGSPERAGVVKPGARLRTGQEFYDHRVIMVTRNDHAMGLFNGDVGVVMPDNQDASRMVAWFETARDPARPEARVYRKVPCRLLPDHETAFAMTVHKAQGSEFGHVLVLLPGRDSPILTRELVYTAITRTRNGVELWCNQDVFEAAVQRTVDRFSGLLATLDA